MTYIVSYQKHTDEYTTYQLVLPVDADGQHIGIELATVDGLTYVALPDTAQLPEQPQQIASSVQTATMTQPLRERIKAVSPHCKLISERMLNKIRDAYTLDDELYYARIAGGASNGLYSPTSEEFQELQVYTETLESIRQRGRNERAKLGL